MKHNFKRNYTRTVLDVQYVDNDPLHGVCGMEYICSVLQGNINTVITLILGLKSYVLTH